MNSQLPLATTRCGDIEAVLVQAKRLVADGADIIDIGGESTHPGDAIIRGRSVDF